MHKFFSILITLTGILLLLYMVVVEDEPGAIPLIMITAGIGWYFFTRYKWRLKKL